MNQTRARCLPEHARRVLLAICVTTIAAPFSSAQTPPIPLPPWFREIDTANTGEISRADFLKYRLESFVELDTDKNGQVMLEEFIKVAEPPFTPDLPDAPPLDERRRRARADFVELDTNRNGILERGEVEVVIHAEFNQYDRNLDNKVTEAELREVQQETLQRQRADQHRRRGLAVNDFIDHQLQEADALDVDRDGQVSVQEYLVQAGPPDNEKAKDLLPFEMRRALVLLKFQEIDANRDGFLDRRELTFRAVKEFTAMDTNKDRFVSEEEFKKAQEAEAAKMWAIVQQRPPGALPVKPPPAAASRASRSMQAVGSLEQGVKALQVGDVVVAESELSGLADAHDPRARFLLGVRVYGDPASKLFDLAKSTTLLLDAAEHGYVPAMLPLAGAFEEGKGVPKSAFNAYKWLAIAERWNAPVARAAIERVASGLKPGEREQAESAARSYTFKAN